MCVCVPPVRIATGFICLFACTIQNIIYSVCDDKAIYAQVQQICLFYSNRIDGFIYSDSIMIIPSLPEEVKVENELPFSSFEQQVMGHAHLQTYMDDVTFLTCRRLQ